MPIAEHYTKPRAFLRADLHAREASPELLNTEHIYVEDVLTSLPVPVKINLFIQRMLLLITPFSQVVSKKILILETREQ